MANDYSILIIDDDHTVLDLFTEVFCKEGFYKTMGVETGRDIEGIIKEKKPDIVLLDIDIPGEDSIKILHRIKMVNRRLPVIILADEANKALAEKAIGYDASSYLIKTKLVSEIVKDVKSQFDKYLHSRPVKNAEILIVDDDKEIADMVKNFLANDGYSCWAVYNAKDAIAATRSHKPRLMLLDIVMPDIDGIELIESIKGIDSRIKIIMMSGVSDKDICTAAIRKGASGYITKPFSLQQLRVTVVATLLE
jgi:DNA-binding NtrC family response regulator